VEEGRKMLVRTINTAAFNVDFLPLGICEGLFLSDFSFHASLILYSRLTRMASFCAVIWLTTSMLPPSTAILGVVHSIVNPSVWACFNPYAKT
jgi:hypothetical protein